MTARAQPDAALKRDADVALAAAAADEPTHRRLVEIVAPHLAAAR